MIKYSICGFCEQVYKQEIEKLQNDGAIIYHGLVDDMRKIYKQVQ